MGNKAHFKRIGTSSNLRLVGHDDKRFYAEWSQGLHGALFIKEYEGDQITRRDGVRTYGEDFTAIQNAIQTFVGQPLILENFIESYFISARDCPTDRDFIGDHDITGMTVREVIGETGINLAEYFAGWNKRESMLPIVRILQAPPDSVLDMRFDKLHDLIHWNNHKQDYVGLFMAGIGKEQL